MIYNPTARFNIGWLNDTLSILNDRINALEEIAAEYVAEQEDFEPLTPEQCEAAIKGYVESAALARLEYANKALAQPAPEENAAAGIA
ncbi:hypothetical protein FBR42_13705 [Salmonella enterica subsp. enterica serovar Hull]|nr:hypothetical protein [Salmonella enterica subsp. enterica serovar Virchow]ECG7219799.1 hypothetical protein [Salmonella enterica subsp. enterica serovar Hull]